MRFWSLRGRLDLIECRCRCSLNRNFASSSTISASQSSSKPGISSRFRLAPDFTPDLPRLRRSREPKRLIPRDEQSSWRSGAPERLNAAKPTSPSKSSNYQEKRTRGSSSSNLRIPSLLPSGAITSIPENSPSLSFSSTTLSPGLQEMLKSQLGKTKIKPTVIQSLSMERFFYPTKRQLSKYSNSEIRIKDGSPLVEGSNLGSETLLAAETGSGKTLAYLLPLLNRLVKNEKESAAILDSQSFNPLVQPRAIILAPTHELARQLAASAKGLCHIDKLRVLCLSSGGWLEALKEDVASASASASLRDIGELSSHSSTKPQVDIIVSTPARLLDVIKSSEERTEESKARSRLVQDGKLEANRGSWKRQLVSLDRATSIVVDEADALFDRDFVGATRAVLHRMREAAEKRLGVATTSTDSLKESDENEDSSLSTSSSSSSSSSCSPPLYDLILATATIPMSLSKYLSSHHPDLVSLLSPGLHRLPPNLKTTFVDPGSSKHAAVAAQVKKVLDEDEARFQSSAKKDANKRCKVLIFVNKTRGVELLSDYLTDRGIENVAITGSGEARSMRSNHHLSGFLPPKKGKSFRQASSVSETSRVQDQDQDQDENGWESEEDEEIQSRSEELKSRHNNDSTSNTTFFDPPRVLITTSLLARGLDFLPDTQVFLPDASPSRGSRSSSYNPSLKLSAQSNKPFDLHGDISSISSSSSGGGLAAANSSLELLHRAGRAARAGRSGRVVLFDSKSAGDRPLINKSGRRVGRVRGRAEKMVEEVTRRKKHWKK